MQVRIGTITLTDEDRRAIRFANSKRRTPATRDESRIWVEETIQKALGELRYRWEGTENTPVDGDVAAQVSADKANDPATETETPRYRV
jgi:hypothetical protein